MNPKNIFSRNANIIPLAFYRLNDLGSWIKNSIFNHYPLHTPTAYTPFFIIGAQRSGSTLLRSILVANQKIAIPPETFVLYKAFRKFRTHQHLDWKDLSRLIISEFESHKNFGRWNTNLFPCYQAAFQLPKKERSLAKLIEIIYSQYIEDNNPTAEMWGDKTPYNTLYINWIYKLYPKAKYVHLLRDGRDAINSLLKLGWYTNINDACWRWETSVRMAQKLKAKLEEDSFLEIKYEHLVREPQKEIKRLCTFLRIQFSPEMLNPQQTAGKIMKNTIATPQHKNILKPINSSRIGNWEQELDASQKALIHRHIGKTLRRLKYLD